MEIISPQFKELESGFIRWLQTLNYSEETVKTRKRNIREFLLYLERCSIEHIESMADEKIKLFVRYLQRRENRLYGSGLMNASINVSIGSVNKFFEYLQQTGSPVVDNLKYMENNYKSKSILTMNEINQLYETTYQKHHFANDHTQTKQEAVSQRDRAMLSIYYGCGLRKSEGTNLNTGDILIERKLIHVRKGKGSKERYVPVTDNNLKYLTEYLNIGRPLLLTGNECVSKLLSLARMGAQNPDCKGTAQKKCCSTRITCLSRLNEWGSSQIGNKPHQLNGRENLYPIFPKRQRKNFKTTGKPNITTQKLP